MLLGWIGCPQCDYRRRVCVEIDGTPESVRFLVVVCHNDSSTHRISLVGFKPIDECPAELKVAKPSDFAAGSEHVVWGDQSVSVRRFNIVRGLIGVVIIAVVIAGLILAFMAWNGVAFGKRLG